MSSCSSLAILTAFHLCKEKAAEKVWMCLSFVRPRWGNMSSNCHWSRKSEWAEEEMGRLYQRGDRYELCNIPESRGRQAEVERDYLNVSKEITGRVE